MRGKNLVEANNADDHGSIIEKWHVSLNFDPGEVIATKCERIWTLLEPLELSGERMETLKQCVHCNHHNHRFTVAIVYDKGFLKSSVQRTHKEDTCGVQKSSPSTTCLSKQARKHSIKQARWNETHLSKENVDGRRINGTLVMDGDGLCGLILHLAGRALQYLFRINVNL